MPRPMYGLPGNMVAKYGAHPSVIELPRKTTRFSSFTGGESLAFASRYLWRFAQSLRSLSSCACWRWAISSAVGLGDGVDGAPAVADTNRKRATARQEIFTLDPSEKAGKG